VVILVVTEGVGTEVLHGSTPFMVS
jgi:hypothetical protein